VHIGYGDEALQISVRDDGSGPNGAPPGTGLLGMRERVAVYGGTLTSGAADGGGFELRAELPLAAS
jgi:signal transduction histidine kinase